VFYYRTVTALATRATGGRSQHTYYPLNGSIIASIWDGFPNGNITVETYGGSCRSIGNPSTQRALWAVEGICCGDDWIKRKLGAGYPDSTWKDKVDTYCLSTEGETVPRLNSVCLALSISARRPV